MTLPSFTDVGSGPAVICLHGVGSGKEGFVRQQNALVGADLRFVAIDAPGFGQTPAATAISFDDHVDAVINMMDHLKIDRAVLLGHSLGGMTAQEVFARHTERVAALILSATSPAFGKPGGDFQKEFIASRVKPFEDGMSMHDFARSFGAKLIGPAPESGTLDDVIATLSNVPIDSYIHAMKTLTTFDRRDTLATIDVPTLLIAGSHDANSPAPMMEKMASKISNSQFQILENTGHMAPIENSAKFNHHVLEFLKGLPSC